MISSYHRMVFSFGWFHHIIGRKKEERKKVKWYTKIHRFQLSCQNLYSILYPECIVCVCVFYSECFFFPPVDWGDQHNKQWILFSCIFILVQDNETYPILWNTAYLSSFHEIKIHRNIEKKNANKFANKSILKSFSLFRWW